LAQKASLLCHKQLFDDLQPLWQGLSPTAC
jgi:hypothetical protein